MLVSDRYTKYDNQAFFFDETTEQLSETSFQVTYNFRTKSSYIPAEDCEKIFGEKEKIIGMLPIAIYFNK